MNPEDARNAIVRLNASLRKAGLDWVVQEVSTVVERGIEERKEVAFESFDASDEPIKKRGRKTEVTIRLRQGHGVPEGLNGDLDRLPMPRSAAVPGGEFKHRPGACSCRFANTDWRRDAARTRRRGRLRYTHLRHA